MSDLDLRHLSMFHHKEAWLIMDKDLQPQEKYKTCSKWVYKNFTVSPFFNILLYESIILIDHKK